MFSSVLPLCAACACLLLASCARPEVNLEVDQLSVAVHCSDPRPQLCTMDYRPVCATRDNGLRCVTTPCDSSETVTYANACSACADARVVSHVAAACPQVE